MRMRLLLVRHALGVGNPTLILGREVAFVAPYQKT